MVIPSRLDNMPASLRASARLSNQVPTAGMNLEASNRNFSLFLRVSLKRSG